MTRIRSNSNIVAATAREILNRYPDKTVVVLEKEPEVAAHQTGHNSGVVGAWLITLIGANILMNRVKTIRA